MRGPFASEDESPAARAGVEVGDRLDLRAMRCIPLDTELCASSLALWGGVTYVLPGRTATLILEPHGEAPAREVHLVAKPRPRSVAVDIVLVLLQTAGVLVVLGAAYLVWIRPGPMTWGFFVYVMYFNPGQSFQWLAYLQQWPRAQFMQDVVFCVLQALGYAGLLLFALRAPVDRAEGDGSRSSARCLRSRRPSSPSSSRASAASSASAPSSPCARRSSWDSP